MHHLSDVINSENGFGKSGTTVADKFKQEKLIAKPSKIS